VVAAVVIVPVLIAVAVPCIGGFDLVGCAGGAEGNFGSISAEVRGISISEKAGRQVRVA
jgi:hypothetical protein